MIHTEIINYVIKKKGFRSYLEIGVHCPEHNFDLIEVEHKIGVDPEPKGLHRSGALYRMTSDEFFKQNTQGFDIVFIDGLHWHEQVKRDFENACECLTDGGIVLIHDTDPKSEEFASWPRNAPRRWNGSVFKFLPYLRLNDYRTPDVDANGLTIVKNVPAVNTIFPKDIDYKYFTEHRKELLNLCTRKEFEDWI